MKNFTCKKIPERVSPSRCHVILGFYMALRDTTLRKTALYAWGVMLKYSYTEILPMTQSTTCTENPTSEDLSEDEIEDLSEEGIEDLSHKEIPERVLLPPSIYGIKARPDYERKIVSELRLLGIERYLISNHYAFRFIEHYPKAVTEVVTCYSTPRLQFLVMKAAEFKTSLPCRMQRLISSLYCSSLFGNVGAFSARRCWPSDLLTEEVIPVRIEPYRRGTLGLCACEGCWLTQFWFRFHRGMAYALQSTEGDNFGLRFWWHQYNEIGERFCACNCLAVPCRKECHALIFRPPKRATLDFKIQYIRIAETFMSFPKHTDVHFTYSVVRDLVIAGPQRQIPNWQVIWTRRLTCCSKSFKSLQGLRVHISTSHRKKEIPVPSSRHRGVSPFRHGNKIRYQVKTPTALVRLGAVKSQSFAEEGEALAQRQELLRALAEYKASTK